MAMEKLQHASHACLLTSPETVEKGICNICYKDEPVEFACNPCNFDLCKSCSKLPPTVSHEFHSEHPLEFCLRKQHDQIPQHILCSCCGCLSSSESFYECKECEIYLDLSCALLSNIFRSWDANKKLHYSHAHLLKRCRPGPDARDSCLLCELPLTPSAICYGCLDCYSFVHERCLDFPIEIQHPVHPAHPLRRLDYTQNCGSGIFCDGCGTRIDTVPIGCLECRFYLHLRCADSSLRHLMHKSHEHRLFYRATGAKTIFEGARCDICKRRDMVSLDSYYRCLECDCKIHFECLEFPRCVIEKKFHIHPLVCKIFQAEKNSVEYCGVCETMVKVGHHAYICKVCDFLGHIECILRKETPSPMYLKALYSCGKEVAKGTYQQVCETNKMESKLLVNGIGYIHVLRPQNMKNRGCRICDGIIFGTPWICETSDFNAHANCAKLAQPSRHRLHSEHDLILLPSYPAGFVMNCNRCNKKIFGFNLFCRICNLITCMSCVVILNQLLGVLRRGQKVIGFAGKICTKHRHDLYEVKVSVSYLINCLICGEKVCGKGLSCMECEDIYHPRCFELADTRILKHPLHSHNLVVKNRAGSNCIACKQIITMCALFCLHCEVGFHVKCSQGVDASGKNKFHEHTLYNFWIGDSRVIQACSVCGKPCGASFYGCIDCNFGSHLECLGFPGNVKPVRGFASFWEKNCALCSTRVAYKTCIHCTDSFQMRCLMTMEDREAASKEEQLGDVYFIYIERFLLNMFKEEKEREEKEKENAKREKEDARFAFESGECMDDWSDEDNYY